MKTASIICTVVLLGLLSLVLSATKRDGFVILLDESYGIELVADLENLSDFRAGQPYNVLTNDEVRRAVEDEENFNPETILETGGAIYLTDSKRGKVSRFSLTEGLKAIAVFGGKLKKLQHIFSDKEGNVFVQALSDSKGREAHLIKLRKLHPSSPN